MLTCTFGLCSYKVAEVQSRQNISRVSPVVGCGIGINIGSILVTGGSGRLILQDNV